MSKESLFEDIFMTLICMFLAFKDLIIIMLIPNKLP